MAEFGATEISQLTSGLSDSQKAAFQAQYDAVKKDPQMIFILSIVAGGLGIDRFMLDDTKMGVIKLLHWRRLRHSGHHGHHLREGPHCCLQQGQGRGDHRDPLTSSPLTKAERPIWLHVCHLGGMELLLRVFALCFLSMKQ